VNLDPRTASAATGIPTRTIQRWALTGRLADHGDGWNIRVDPYEVLELAEMRGQGGRLRNTRLA
jgi:hypothetical protein